jgi:ribulose-phosphate 3-epimerase
MVLQSITYYYSLFPFLKWIKDFKAAGCDLLTFHIESDDEPEQVIQAIRAEGMKVGIALKPSTPLEVILPFVKKANFILVMSVEPGFGGQKFLPQTMEKVRFLRRLYPYLDIGVDGGISKDTIDVAAQAGSNVIIAGTSIFKASAPSEIIAYLRERVSFYRQQWPSN